MTLEHCRMFVFQLPSRPCFVYNYYKINVREYRRGNKKKSIGSFEPFWIWTIQALEIITRDVNHYEAHSLSLLSFYFDILFFSCLLCLSKFWFNALFTVVNPCTGTSWKIYFLIHSYETFFYAQVGSHINLPLSVRLSYSFGATALIFCRMFKHIMEVCMSTGFWFHHTFSKWQVVVLSHFVRPSGYRYMVCPAISSYSFGATALILYRIFIHIMP